MPEIAYTTVGRNALFVGLISHFTAILGGMIPASGDNYFQVVFLFSCLSLIVGAYVELKHRGSHPFKEGLFYTISAVTVLPLIGPIITMGLLYGSQRAEQRGGIIISGFFSALFRIKANILIIFLLGTLLCALFILPNSKDEPYYKKKYQNRQNRHVSQAIFTAGQQAQKAY